MTQVKPSAAPQPPAASRTLWRIDRFLLPETARAAVLERLRRTHDEIERLAGCLVSRVVEAPAVEGRQELLTLAAWRDEASFLAARAMMQRIHAESGFDPAAFLGRHGVTMTPALYRDVIADRDEDPVP